MGPAESSPDVLSEIPRTGAKRLLAEALEVEIEEFLGHYCELRDKRGRQRIVRDGYLPYRAPDFLGHSIGLG